MEKTIQSLIAEYKKDFPKYWDKEKFKWQAVQCFQNYWDIDDPDFGVMFEQATSKASTLLTSKNIYARKFIINLAQEFPTDTKQMFVELFDESLGLTQRIDSFNTRAKSLRKEHNNRQPNDLWNSTFQNENAITTYLWLRYPDKYYIYKYSEFKDVADKLGYTDKIRKGEGVNNVRNGFEIYDTVCNALLEDTELPGILSQLITDDCYPDKMFKTLTIDFGHYISSYMEKKETTINKVEEPNTNLTTGKDAKREQVKKDFEFFLFNTASQTTKASKKPESIKSIIKNLDPDFIYDVVPDLRRDIESFYDIQDPERISNILQELKRNYRFDSNDNKRYRQTALNQYLNFLNISAHFKSGQHKQLEDTHPLLPDLPTQIIYYGAPGTGKSNKIKRDVDERGMPNVRTTFHPDSDYSTFVGAYKPTMRPVADKYKAVAGKDEEIAYEFIPQAFLKAYTEAWKNQGEPFYLIIEEINRGNCAQVFGDLFQLLDRNDNGYSDYPISPDEDIKNYLAKEFENVEFPSSLANEFKGYKGSISNDLKLGKVLVLPNNLRIWATMNTSDQSLFPIDSAFKRRWDWVYMPIGYKNRHWTIEIGDKEYKWDDFQKVINQKIYDVDNSEDKQLGDYFVNADRTGGKISADTLLNKILFYIWNDVCKDDPDQIFRWNDGNQEGQSIKFSDFFGADRDKKLQGFMAFHKVPRIEESSNENNSDDEQDSEGTETGQIPAEDDNEVNS